MVLSRAMTILQMNNKRKPNLTNPVHLLAFGFGSGLAPQAPGTVGTLAGVLLYIPLSFLEHDIYLSIVILSAILGVWICGRAAEDLQVHDHPGIVWDEFVGYWVTMLWAPSGWMWLIVGFILFRLFDVWKPWPICLLDKHVPEGLGIMLDDILAGVFSLVLIQAVNYWVI